MSKCMSSSAIPPVTSSELTGSYHPPQRSMSARSISALPHSGGNLTVETIERQRMPRSPSAAIRDASSCGKQMSDVLGGLQGSPSTTDRTLLRSSPASAANRDASSCGAQMCEILGDSVERVRLQRRRSDERPLLRSSPASAANRNACLGGKQMVECLGKVAGSARRNPRVNTARKLPWTDTKEGYAGVSSAKSNCNTQRNENVSNNEQTNELPWPSPAMSHRSVNMPTYNPPMSMSASETPSSISPMRERYVSASPSLSYRGDNSYASPPHPNESPYSPGHQRPKLTGHLAYVVAERNKASVGIPWRQIPPDHTLPTAPLVCTSYASSPLLTTSPRLARIHPQAPIEPYDNPRTKRPRHVVNFPRRTQSSQWNSCATKNAMDESPHVPLRTPPNNWNSCASKTAMDLSPHFPQRTLPSHWNSCATKNAMDESPLPKVPEEEYTVKSPYAWKPLSMTPLRPPPRLSSFSQCLGRNLEEINVGQSMPNKRRDYAYSVIKPDVQLTRSTSLKAPLLQGTLSCSQLSQSANTQSTWLVSSTQQVATVPGPEYAHSVVAKPELQRQRRYIRWKN